MGQLSGDPPGVVLVGDGFLHEILKVRVLQLVLVRVATVAGLALVPTTAAASGEEILEETLEEAFAHSDSNDDRFVDRREYYSRLVDVFFFADRDRSSTLEAGEYDATTLGTFEEADSDGDGKVTLVEFMNLGFDYFEAADEDGDGRLSWEETDATWD